MVILSNDLAQMGSYVLPVLFHLLGDKGLFDSYVNSQRASDGGIFEFLLRRH